MHKSDNMRYIKVIIILLVMLKTKLPLHATMHRVHHPSNRGYIDWPSWAIYLHQHPGYKGYQPPNNITKNGCQWGTWVTFAQKIQAIQAHVGDFKHPSALLHSKDFLVMYKHPLYYREAILDYLIGKNYNLMQKKIAIYASPPCGLCEVSYQLYQEKKIDLSLLELIFAINLGNFIAVHAVGNFYENIVKTLHPATCKLLEKISKEIPTNTVLYKDVIAVLNNHFPETWYNHLLLSQPITASHEYYQAPFPFYDSITDAVRDKKYWEKWTITPDITLGLENIPYFLMIMEHPQYYYPVHVGPFSDSNNGIRLLRSQDYADQEKTMAIFGMSQLGILSPYESSIYYAFFLENACEWYKKGNLTTEHLYQLFQFDFQTFYKYPFFIIDYKEKAVQKALDKFIATPTIPCGLKEMARKVKNGTLATKEEMAYMEGYRQFRKKHFTLYETIRPCLSK